MKVLNLLGKLTEINEEKISVMQDSKFIQLWKKYNIKEVSSDSNIYM